MSGRSRFLASLGAFVVALLLSTNQAGRAADVDDGWCNDHYDSGISMYVHRFSGGACFKCAVHGCHVGWWSATCGSAHLACVYP